MSSTAHIERKTAPRAGAKRARTRQRLLDVATAVFETRGIYRVSLDEIAAEAGVTKGAIYSSFASKDDLVFAMASERVERGLIAFDDQTPPREQLRALVRRTFGVSRKRTYFAFLAELDLYALSRPDLSRRFMESARQRHARSAAQLERFKDDLALPPLQFAIATQAIFAGLMFQRACFPDAISEAVALQALGALLRPDG